MNFEERKRVIAQWINPETGYLGRYKPPQGFDAVAMRAEMVELVEALAESLPLVPNEAALMEFLNSVGKVVYRGAKSRSWPLLSAYVDAIDAVRKRPVPKAITGEVRETDATFEARIRYAGQWWAEKRDLPPWWDNRAVTEVLMDRGIADYEALKEAGCDVPLRKEAGRFLSMAGTRFSKAERGAEWA